MKQGKYVYYNNGTIEGFGKIKGLVTDLPLTGKQYIVEDLVANIPNETYPYNHFVIAE